MEPANPARGRATYRDLCAVPEHLIAEILLGELHVQPRPAGAHAHAAAVLGMDLGSPFHRGRGGPGGWWILDEPELHLADDVLVPDLAAWRRTRLPGGARGAWLDIAPDWVCEVLSPSTARTDREIKLPIYAQAGVAHCWLVDPLQHTLQVFSLQRGHWQLHASHAGDSWVRAAPFEAVALELGALWLPALDAPG